MGRIWVSGVGTAAGLKSGQSNRKREFGIAGLHTGLKANPVIHKAQVTIG
jgi:hypothetical protein